MKPNTVIHVLLGVSVVINIGLVCLTVVDPGQPGLPQSRRALFAALGLIPLINKRLASRTMQT
jgi:hypothetical protein